MANTSSISLTTLDVNDIKESLKSYLKTQDIFKDFDFDGTNMNVLLSILAHNTFKQAFYTNMVAAEMFLDSAQLPSSIRSHAKELNYVPLSARSAKATINLNFKTNPSITGADTVVIPKGTAFSAISNFRTYMFTVPQTITTASANNTFSIPNIDIYEGNYVNDTYVMDYRNETQRFIITNEMVDTDSISVTVVEDDGLNVLTYQKKTTLLDINSSSKIFFLQPGPGEKYEIIFGDNILGRKPKNDSVIIIEYRISSGPLPNGANKFALSDDFTSGAFVGNVAITTIQAAADGANPESIESIRYNAPRHFQVQERAVTTNDYEVILKQEFTEINAISVYGGEEVSPPRYGKVYIAVDITNVDGFPESKKKEYYNFIKQRSPLSIDPVFIEPEYVYFDISTLVKYNINLTTLKSEDIKTLVKNSIIEFNDLYLNDFKSTLRYSKLVTTIDAAHSSIVSNDTDIKVYKKINPVLDTFQNFDLRFNIAVDKTKRVSSTNFIQNGVLTHLSDDGQGNIYLITTINGSAKRLKKIGSISYTNGRIILRNFTCQSYAGASIKIRVTPAEKDFSSNQNQILTVESDEIGIQVERVRE